MTRAVAPALVVALKTKGKQSAGQLAHQCGAEVTTIREWLYDMEKIELVRRVKRTQPGRHSGRSTFFWEWIQ